MESLWIVESVEAEAGFNATPRIISVIARTFTERMIHPSTEGWLDGQRNGPLSLRP